MIVTNCDIWSSCGTRNLVLSRFGSDFSLWYLSTMTCDIRKLVSSAEYWSSSFTYRNLCGELGSDALYFLPSSGCPLIHMSDTWHKEQAGSHPDSSAVWMMSPETPDSCSAIGPSLRLSHNWLSICDWEKKVTGPSNVESVRENPECNRQSEAVQRMRPTVDNAVCCMPFASRYKRQ